MIHTRDCPASNSWKMCEDSKRPMDEAGERHRLKPEVKNCTINTEKNLVWIPIRNWVTKPNTIDKPAVWPLLKWLMYITNINLKIVTCSACNLVSTSDKKILCVKKSESKKPCHQSNLYRIWSNVTRNNIYCGEANLFTLKHIISNFHFYTSSMNW